MSNLPQQDTINQFNVMAPTTTFPYTFLVLLSTDMAVYINDTLIDASLYTVNNVGTEDGGTVVFNSAVDAGNIVTLVRDMQIAIDTNYQNAQTFNGANLDTTFERVTLFTQQVNTVQAQRCLQYPLTQYFPNSVPIPNIVPVFTEDNQIWQYFNGQINVVVLEENPNVSTLRAQLAINLSAMNAGATLVGYYNSITATPTNLNSFLQDVQNTTVPTKGAALLGYNGTISSATTIKSALENLQTQITNLNGLVSVGDIIYTGIEKDSASFLLCNGAAISRTTYAVLFAAIGTAFGTGDGTTTFNVPNLIQKFPYGATPGTQGALGGDATVSLTEANNGPHTHNVPAGALGSHDIGSSYEGGSGEDQDGPQVTASSGSGTPFSILPPYQSIIPYIRYA